jgi:hypothetical protein
MSALSSKILGFLSSKSKLKTEVLDKLMYIFEVFVVSFSLSQSLMQTKR